MGLEHLAPMQPAPRVLGLGLWVLGLSSWVLGAGWSRPNTPRPQVPKTQDPSPAPSPPTPQHPSTDPSQVLGLGFWVLIAGCRVFGLFWGAGRLVLGAESWVILMAKWKMAFLPFFFSARRETFQRSKKTFIGFLDFLCQKRQKKIR